MGCRRRTSFSTALQRRRSGCNLQCEGLFCGLLAAASADGQPRQRDCLPYTHSGGFFVLQGSMSRGCCNPSMVHQLHSRAGGTFCLLAAGFPCQPFSCQGDCLGLADLRGKMLHATLRCGWLTQSVGIVLECVANIINYPEALCMIQA